MTPRRWALLLGAAFAGGYALTRYLLAPLDFRTVPNGFVFDHAPIRTPDLTAHWPVDRVQGFSVSWESPDDNLPVLDQIPGEELTAEQHARYSVFPPSWRPEMVGLEALADRLFPKEPHA